MAALVENVSFSSRKQIWPSGLTQDECKARLVAMNDDPSVLGVILQRPVPRHINVRSLASAIHPFKDIEGMNPHQSATSSITISRSHLVLLRLPSN